ncbi:hypothetical protein [Amycolatopsis sp. Hca4]|uniref:hypothetical protein n=1 Tax=Amycolatopsis sp. Hca4 TaxID=2742131 RepID=UPI0015915EA0|nr:hypothetical protein [Amycolatopsis sp. Hca4]QKV74948.1 hypothetical protein HUT10_15095 [Amycolatopsis sp. Hca4]
MHDFDQGKWLVTHIDQQIATFYIPLPEAMGFPKLSQHQYFLTFDREQIESLKKTDEDITLLSIEQPGNPAIVLSRSQHHEITNWSNKATLDSSLVIHQVEALPWVRMGLDAALSVWQFNSSKNWTNDTRMRPVTMLRELEENLLEDPTFAGGSVVTVVEAAVPLYLLGELGDLPPVIQQSENSDHTTNLARQTPLNFCRLTKEDFNDILYDRLILAFNTAVNNIQSLQKGYHAVTREPVTLITRERVPFTVPVTLRRLRDIGNSAITPKKCLLGVNANTWHVNRPRELTPDEIKNVSWAQHAILKGAFSAHLDLHREADAALRRHGDTRAGALMAALAAEALFDDLLLYLQWEEGSSPEESAKHWIAGLDSRIKREFPRRLGGNWSFKQKNIIANWNTNVAELRHRIVHGGYTPTIEEASNAYSTVNRLTEFLCDRLASPQQLKKYARTALALAGVPGLVKRGAYSKRLKELQSSPAEVSWSQTFTRWRDAQRRLRRDNLVEPRKADSRSTIVMAVHFPDGNIRWCLHDRVNHLAAPAEVSYSALNQRSWDGISQISSKLQAEQSGEPVSLEVDVHDSTGVRQVGPWREEYHLVPMAGVLIDNSDLDNWPEGSEPC